MDASAQSPSAPTIVPLAPAASPQRLPVERMRPHGLGMRWLLDLYVRPGRALDRPGLAVSGATLFVVLWLMGAAWTAPWSGVLGLVLMGGIIWGALRLVTLGSLFRLRLWLAGARGVTWEESYRLYLLSSLVASLPTTVYLIAMSVASETPAEAVQNPPLGFVLLMVLPLWSCWTAYRGARVAFGARRGPAIFWLLVVPWGTFGAMFVGAMVAAVAMIGAPDLMRMERFETAAIGVDVPSNWSASVEPMAGAPSWVVVAGDEFGYSRFEACMFGAAWTPDDAIREYTLDIVNGGHAIVENRPLRRWGRYSGAGVDLETTFEGEPMAIRALVFEIEESVLMQLTAIAPAAQSHVLDPAFDRMVSSLSLTPPSQQGADLEEARPWQNRLFTLSRPGNWILEAWSDEGEAGPGMAVTAPDGSWVAVASYRAPVSPMVILWDVVRYTVAEADEAEIVAELTSYGATPCIGRSVRTVAGGQEVLLNFYIVPLNDEMVLEIREVQELSGRERSEPGFALLRNTLQLQPGAAVDVARLDAPAPDEPALGSVSPRF